MDASTSVETESETDALQPPRPGDSEDLYFQPSSVDLATSGVDDAFKPSVLCSDCQKARTLDTGVRELGTLG